MTEQATFADDGWRDFVSRLRAYVHRRVDPAWADDVVGDVLLRLVRHSDDLRAAASPSAWMFTVAANALADHHRRRDAERRALVRAGTEQAIAGTAADPEDAGSELSGCIRPLLQGLPAQYAEALLLTEVEGVSQSDAAKRLGLSFSGMKSRVQRARGKLKDAMLRCCTVELDRRGRVLGYATATEARCGSCDCAKRR